MIKCWFQMLKSMHARHITFRFFSISSRNDQLTFFSFVDRQNTWFRRLVRKRVEFITNATIVNTFKNLNENDENDENDEKFFCKLFDFVSAKTVECQRYLTFNMIKRSFFSRMKIFETVCVWIEMWKIIKTIEICRNIASFRIMKKRFFRQIFEHACEIH